MYFLGYAMSGIVSNKEAASVKTADRASSAPLTLCFEHFVNPTTLSEQGG